MMASSPTSHPPGNEVGAPAARAEAPADSNRRTEEDGGAKKVDRVQQEKLVGEVVALREELDTRELTGNARVAEAEGRLAATNERAADMLDSLSKHESKEEERLAMWKHVTEDLQEMTARRQRGEGKSPQKLPGDGWGGMTESLDSEMARFTSRVEAAGPSPSSVVRELRARDADLEEERRGPCEDIERRKQRLVDLEKRYTFDKRISGSATTNTNTETSEQSATTTRSPSVGGLRREKRYLRKRIEVYNELTQRLLSVIDGRQTAADEGIRRLEEALGVCNARRTIIRDTIKGLMKEMNKVSARVREVQLTQVASHTPPANSISTEITNWKEGVFHKAFVEHVRAAAAAAAAAAAGGEGGDSEGKDVFIAEEFLSAEKELYVKREVLGEGGFGRVDKVSAFTPPEYFALKSMKTDMAEGSVQDASALKLPRENLIAEMAVHCRLPAHVNVTQAFAMSDHNSDKMQVLLELGGGDMSKPSWGLTSTSLCELMGHLAGAAAGLVFLHEHGIGHNDLKPANILLFKGEPGSGLTAKLADFGLALAFGDMRKGHGSLGITPPEAILEKYMVCRPDQDIFAMGHLILLIVAKTLYKSHNMWLSRAVRPKDYHKKQETLDFAGMYRFMEKKTLRRMVSPYYRRKVFDPENISDELGDKKAEVLEMVDLMTSADPSRRPPMKTVVNFATRIHQHLLENRVSSVAGSSSASEADEESAGSEQSVPSTWSSLATTADLPSVEVLPAEETSGGSDDDVGSTSGPLVPVVGPAKPEGYVRRSDSGAVAGEIAGSPDATIDGGARADAPAVSTVVVAAAAAPPPDDAAAAVADASAAAGPTAADPEQSAPPARSTLGSSNATTTDPPSGEVLSADETGGGSDGGSGSTGGPSVPVVAPAKPEGDIRRSGLGTVAGETVGLPEAVTGGAAVPTAAGAASPAGDVTAAASASSASPAAVAAVAAVAAASAASPTDADSEPSAPSARSILGGINATTAELPLVHFSPVEEAGGGSDGGGGSTSGPPVPVVAPANRERDVRQPELGTVAGETTGLPEAIINDAAAPAAAGAAAPAAVAVVAAATPCDASPCVAATPAAAAAFITAAAAAGATRSRNSGGSGGGGGGGGDGGGDGDGVCIFDSGGGSVGDGGCVCRSLDPVVTPANRERDPCLSELGPVAGETARLPEAIVDGAAAPTSAGTASRADAAAVAAGIPPAAAPTVAAAGATRSSKGGGGSGAGSCGGGGGGGGRGGHSVMDGAVCAASLMNAPSATTVATVVQDTPVCVAVEEFVSTGERERQAPAPDLVGSRCVVPCPVSNAKAATDDTGLPPSRIGYVPEVCSSKSCSSGGVAAGAPVLALQASTAVTGRAGMIVPSAVDGGGAARQAPCGGARRPARRTGHGGKRKTGAEWLLQDVCKGDPAALRQKVAGAAAAGGDGGGDDVHDVAPSSVNAGEVETTPRVAASPPPPRSHGVFNIAYVVKAAVARLAPPAWREGSGAARPPSTPGPQAPPPSQAALGWSGLSVFSGLGGLASAEGRAGQRVDGGYRASAGRVTGVPATRAKARQLAGSWHAGIVRGPSYGGLAPHAVAPFGGYGGRAASPQQWPFVACGAPGYLP